MISPESSRMLMAWSVQAVAVLLYWDASRHKIGHTRKYSLSAGAWGFASSYTMLVFAPIAWLFYLLRRKQLIARAKEHPVVLTVAHRIIVTVLIIAAPLCLRFVLVRAG
jgi:hypothetical protein